MSNRREYEFCAKCLEEKPKDTGYVHDRCSGPGGYKGCAVCGKPWKDGESRDYVCINDLIHKAA